jgi:membrane-associated protein
LWIYGILFFIIFAETGFVIFPFLPGDSLLFVAGALAAIGEGGMNIWTLIGVLLAAAVLGNMVNYQIGRLLGPKVFHWENSRFFNKAALVKTHAFYEKHGGKTLVISRFLPLFRTFAPSLPVSAPCPTPSSRCSTWSARQAGSSRCAWRATGWATCPGSRQNLSVLILGIIVVSLIPVAVGYVKHRAAA